jgi:hypothetical protein
MKNATAAGDDRRVAARPGRVDVVAACALLITGATAHAQTADVLIESEVDVSAHNYTWTITNHTNDAIVYVEFPHYHADMFFAPGGWKQECTYLVGIGVPDRPGVCKASVEAARDGIAPGASAEFSMRIASAGAQQGEGVVRVRLEDGTEIKVTGVAVPIPPSTLGKYVPLIGLAAIFVLGIVLHARRQRKNAAPSASDGFTDDPSAS